MTVKTNNQKIYSPERKQSNISKEEEAARDFPELPSATKKKTEDEIVEDNVSEKVEEVLNETPKEKPKKKMIDHPSHIGFS